jgi:Fur family iron response transcriptional regulator
MTDPRVNMQNYHANHSMVSMEERLRGAGLRPTRQRVSLASLIYAQGDRHLSAEDLKKKQYWQMCRYR